MYLWFQYLLNIGLSWLLYCRLFLCRLDPAHTLAKQAVLERSIMRRAEIQPGKRKQSRAPARVATLARALKIAAQIQGKENTEEDIDGDVDNVDESLQPSKRQRLSADQRLAIAPLSPRQSRSSRRTRSSQ